MFWKHNSKINFKYEGQREFGGSFTAKVNFEVDFIDREDFYRLL